jgi:hypothetical protein
VRQWLTARWGGWGSGERGGQAAVEGPGPFIYSALAKRPSPPTLGTTAAAAAAAVWVVGETASVTVRLSVCALS